MFTMARRNAFNDVFSLHDAMNELFANSFVRAPWSAPSGEGWRGFAPALDLSETNDGYKLEVAVPGLKAQDVNITVEGNVLTIGGEIKQEQTSKDDERTYHHTERYYGKFQRSITLPSRVDAQNIQASLNDGILHVELPKVEEVKPRRIEVHVGNKQLTA